MDGGGENLGGVKGGEIVIKYMKTHFLKICGLMNGIDSFQEKTYKRITNI